MIKMSNFKDKKTYLLALTFILFIQCSVLKELDYLSDLQKDKIEYYSDTTRAKLVYTGAYPVIHLYGNPKEMGTQYGKILKPQLKSLFSILVSVFPKKKLDSYIQLGINTEKSLPQSILTEIKAISIASGVDYNLLLAMNVATKVDCSTLAAWGESTPDGELIMGRNAEYKTKGLNSVLGIIVVRHPSHGYSSVDITYLGLAGSFSGMNEKGVCFGNMLAYNGLDKTTNSSGIPIQILFRLGSKAATTPNEFKNILAKNNFMIPNIVLLANKDKAIISEHSQFDNDFREGTKGILASTNFFHSSKLINSSPLKPDKRYSIILNEVKNNYGNLSLEKIKLIMHKARKRKTNIQCVIFEPVKLKMHVSMNQRPASKGPFTIIDVKSLLSQ
jgi:hypothetical protein